MKDYNGFSGEQRAKVGNLITKAIKQGRLSPPSKCCLCGQTKGVLHYHLEDYSKPFEDLRPICVGCHMRLHIRFDYPNLWKKHLQDLRNNKKSPAYQNPFVFFAAMRKAGIKKDIEHVEMVEAPTTWYELLALRPLEEININPSNTLE